MSNDIIPPTNPRNGKALAGIILLAVGAILLMRQFDLFLIPSWLFSTGTWLIVIGLFVGARNNFQKPISIFLILLGVLVLIERITGLSGIVWPVLIIAFGLWLILRRRGSFDSNYWEKRYGHKWDWRTHASIDPNEASVTGDDYSTVPPRPSMYPPSGDDYLDAVSVFGGVKKTILSKDFKGGEIVNVFGGAELDFTQADINGRVIIDITQIFGGTKIIVPSHWQVVSDIAAVFAGFDDKRMRSTATLNSEKILVLKGVSIFAGVDVRSF